MRPNPRARKLLLPWFAMTANTPAPFAARPPTSVSASPYAPADRGAGPAPRIATTSKPFQRNRQDHDHENRTPLHQGGRPAYYDIPFHKVKSEIRDPDGSIVFCMDDVEVPAAWSQVAADVLAQKYFRRAGVPAVTRPVPEDGVPCLPLALGAGRRGARRPVLSDADRFGSETSAKQVFHRLAGAWTYWGWKGGYFDSEADALAFFDELRFMLARVDAAPNSPQWFNTGLHWAYGVDGPARSFLRRSFRPTELVASTWPMNIRSRTPASSSRSADDLVNEGGIIDLWLREARLFRFGSGTGSNFSQLSRRRRKALRRRQIFRPHGLPQSATAPRAPSNPAASRVARPKWSPSTSTTPTPENFIEWKVREEHEVAALVAGSKALQNALRAIARACVNCEGPGDDSFDPEKNPALRREIRLARRAFVPDAAIRQVIHLARQGKTDIDFPAFTTDCGFGSLSDRLRPELQYDNARHRRVPARGRRRRRLD